MEMRDVQSTTFHREVGTRLEDVRAEQSAGLLPPQYGRLCGGP